MSSLAQPPRGAHQTPKGDQGRKALDPLDTTRFLCVTRSLVFIAVLQGPSFPDNGQHPPEA